MYVANICLWTGILLMYVANICQRTGKLIMYVANIVERVNVPPRYEYMQTESLDGCVAPAVVIYPAQTIDVIRVILVVAGSPER